MLPPRYHLLGEREQQYFKDLQAYEAPWLYEKLVQEKQVTSEEDYQLRFTEWKKYVALLRISAEGLGMVSQRVDMLWHQFILFTRHYTDFSEQFYGKYIHHEPKTSFTPLDTKIDERFYEWYHLVYGCVPEIWRG